MQAIHSRGGSIVTYAVAPLLDQRQDPEILTGALGSWRGEEKAIAVPRNSSSS